jgi:hypothetical protein
MACNYTLSGIADESHLHTNRGHAGVDLLRTNQELMWQALSGEQSMTLTLAVQMLQRCYLSPYQILTKTMTALGGLQHNS